MEVSTTCRAFIRLASARTWRDAVVTLNGLDMYEMLRAIKALDASDIRGLRDALNSIGGEVDGPRIDYAITVVETNKLPTTAPGDLGATGQVGDARLFIKKPTSIMVEQIPKDSLPPFNVNVSAVNNTLMQRLYGAPRSSYTAQCQPVENAKLRRRMTTTSVGEFTVTGLDSAVVSLSSIMEIIQRDQRLVYRVLGTAGMFCARYVRGSTSHISNHSWGTAIDLKIAGVLDTRGDNKVQFGLHLISEIFNARGWFWGTGFPTEDAMHFEGGQALVTAWA